MIIVAGNCVLEDMETSVETAEFLLQMSDKYGFEVVYKSSWKKDNRSSAEGYEGPSIDESLKIFNYLRNIGVTIITDFHTPEQLDSPLVGAVDWLQLPAYLCMQNELTFKMADTGKPINIKKGQFLHPEDVRNIIGKIKSRGNDNIMITERGASFGYRDLVLDPRSLHILKDFGYPIFCDVGHLGRKYGVSSSDLVRGGDKRFVYTLARAAVATGICGIFVEVHPEPTRAKCDAATQLSFDEFELLVKSVMPIWKVVSDGDIY
jgi:2-dehydro-3-deoxyphosphooctonate aldolase (KDO 8-P synthase)